MRGVYRLVWFGCSPCSLHATPSASAGAFSTRSSTNALPHGHPAQGTAAACTDSFAACSLPIETWSTPEPCIGTEQVTLAQVQGGAFPLMMYFHRSTTGKSSRPLPFHCLARRGATKRDAPECLIAWERGNLPSARPIRRSPGNPHGCCTSHSRFTVNSKIDLTVDFRRELCATFLPSDLPSN
jgi:hypothetical protein